VLLAVVEAFADPLNTTVAPAPPTTGLIVPDMLKLGLVWRAAVKFIPLTLAPFIKVL
jgi:hypothetical protein